MRSVRRTVVLSAFCAIQVKPQQTSAFDAPERHFAVAFGGGVDVRGLHVATDLMRVAHHADYTAWTWRIAAGVMLPAR